MPDAGDGEPRFVRHAFVCVNEEACARDGPAEAIFRDLKQRLKASGRKEELRVNKSGCLGQCGHGPMMVVYPEQAWYSHLRLEDVPALWEHLQGGPAAESLRYRTAHGGTNVLGRLPDGTCRPVGGAHSEACTRCPEGHRP